MTPEVVAAGILPEPNVILSTDQIEFFHREGYLVIDQISDPEEVERLRVIYDRLFEQRVGRADGNQFDLGGTDEEGKQAVLPQILNPARYAPELIYGVFRANALSIAKQLLGPTATAQGEHAIFKPARIGAPTPWHQDEAYWNPAMHYNAFSLWMPLQPARLDNGCMQFVPRSHRNEILPHRSINNDPRIHGLEMVETPPQENVVACPLPPGGCTVHTNRTFHYTGPNRSDLPRRAYILGFGTQPTKRTDGRRFPWEEAKQTGRQERAKAAQDETKQKDVAKV